MTKYGTTDEIEKLAWGGVKTAGTPATVITIQNTVTDLINLILNRNSDFYNRTYCNRFYRQSYRLGDP
jgi:hypothetical protein